MQSTGEDFQLTLTGMPPQGVPAEICVTPASNVIDGLQTAVITGQDPSTVDPYHFYESRNTEQYRAILDDSQATITGTADIEESLDSFGGSYTSLDESSAAQWIFSDLTPGVYLVSTSVTANHSFPGSLPFTILADDEILSQGQINADDTRSYSQRQVEYDFARDPEVDGSFPEEYGDTGWFPLSHGHSGQYDFVFPSDPVEQQHEDFRNSQDWIALDRVAISAHELTIRIDAAVAGVPADAIRIERFYGRDAELASLSDHGDQLGGRRVLDGSPILDQASESLLFGVNDRLTSSLSSNLDDNRMFVETPDRFFRSESNLDVPDFPFMVTIGQERISIVGWDDIAQALLVERGVNGTAPADHAANDPLNYGFAGQRIQLLEDVTPAKTSLLVQSFQAPKSAQFEIQLIDERMTVTQVTDNFDGTYQIDVLRGARGTQVETAVPSTAQLFLATDQMGANRFVDGNHQGVVGLDYGAVESLSVSVDNLADLPDVQVGDGIVRAAGDQITLRPRSWKLTLSAARP